MKQVSLARIERTRQELATGADHGDVQRRISAEFGIKARAARKYIKRVYDELVEIDRERRPYRKVEMRMTLQRLLASAEAAGDHKAAVTAADRLARLDGLFIDRVEMLVADVSEQRPMTPAEQRRRLVELIAKDPTLLAEVQARQLEAPSGT